MRHGSRRPTDEHSTNAVAVIDIETLAPELPDGLFPPWPTHKVILASVLTVDKRDGEFAFDLRTIMFEGRERDAIAELEPLLAGRTMVSFNGRGFDSAALSMTAMAVGAWNARRLSTSWRDPKFGAEHCDLAEQFSRYGAARGGTLASLCAPLAIPVKTTTAGDGVAELHAAGKADDIARYCEEDVAATYILWLHWAAFRSGDERQIADPLSSFVRWLQAKGPELPHLQQFTRMPKVPWAHHQRLRGLAADALAHNAEAVRIEAEDRIEWFTHAA